MCVNMYRIKEEREDKRERRGGRERRIIFTSSP